MKTSLQKWMPQHFLSRLLGFLANCEIPFLKNQAICRFIRRYQVNMQESLIENPKEFSSFNAFFTRELKKTARPIVPNARHILSPCDGVISAFGPIDETRLFQAKGHLYELSELLAGDQDHTDMFSHGSFLTAYLSPKDYHRVHMPVAGRLLDMVYVPGQLFSVNQQTTEQLPNLFAKNERLIAYFDSEHGPFAMILVGAMIVAAIHTVWAGHVSSPKKAILQHDYTDQHFSLLQGQEMGHFQLGSTVIMLFSEDWSLEWQSVAMGQALKLGQNLANIAE